LQALGFDEWRFADLKKILDDEGIDLPLEPVRQGFKTMAPFVDAFEAAVVNREILHDGNAVLSYCVAMAVVETDPAGNRKLSKKRSRPGIDGAVRLPTALGLHAIWLAEPPENAFLHDVVRAALGDLDPLFGVVA